MSVLTQPPSDFSPDLLHHVRAALRTTGRLLPATDEEVAKSLNAIEARSTESQPDLSDPYELFDTGNSGASASTRPGLKEDPQSSDSPLQDEINRSLAVARNGEEEIPPEIRDRMDEDRKDQEEDSADDRPDGEPSDKEENDESNE
jgi:hypothetical protein